MNAERWTARVLHDLKADVKSKQAALQAALPAAF
jgi:hypothetical protein